MHKNSLLPIRVFLKPIKFGLSVFFLTHVFNTYAGQIDRRLQDSSGIGVLSLHCENQINPSGLDISNPRLGWILKINFNERGQYQTAYRIQVASTKANLDSGKPDLWDSGIIDSSLSNNVKYNGKALASNTRCYWRLKVWDKHHKPSKWSKTEFWEMGLLNDSDWKGNWIEDVNSFSTDENNLYKDNPAPHFRKEFKVRKKIKKAIMYVSGLGYYEAYLNGKKIGNKLLDPGWTNYAKRILYSTYNVTDYIQAGDNCAGMLLGNGWYNPLPLKMWGRINIRKFLSIGEPKFIMQLNIEYSDGTTDQIVSDNSWKVNSGPILQNNIYLGEVYDARKELPGWNIAGIKTDNWRQVQLAKSPGGKLQSQKQPPIIAGDTLFPVAIKRMKDGKYIVDFGRNFGGIINLKAKGEPGTAVTVKYGELLYPDGSLNVMTSTAGQIKRKDIGGTGAPDTAYARDIFILSGKKKEVFQTHFTFHGFRYIEVTGYPGVLKKEDIKGLVLYANVTEAGSFTCSDSLLNQIQNICLNTFRSNIFSVQSDCPQRERFGYGGDIVATCEAFIDNYNMAGFYEKTVNDFVDEVQPDGGITETAPFVGIASDGLAGKAGPVEWGSVLPVLLDRLYQFYGNIELIQQYYPVAKNWVDFMHRHDKNCIINTTIGDHESIDEKLVGLSATAYYYYNTVLVAKFAKLLNRQDEFIKYSALKDSIKTAFIAEFFDPSSGKLGIHTAAAQAYGLYFNLIPDHSIDQVLAVMLQNIAEKNYHVTAGIFGTKILLEVLSQTGNGEIAYKMATQKTFPGWGYMLANGATTLWEHWELSENIYSHNHPMFGSISNWFYRSLAGIRPADDAAGFNKIIIQPHIADLQWSKASYNSVLGKVSTYWKKTGKTFTLDITIPVNASATVYLPASLVNIKERNTSISGKNGVNFLGIENNESIIKLGSGNYHFSALLPDYFP